MIQIIYLLSIMLMLTYLQCPQEIVIQLHCVRSSFELRSVPRELLRSLYTSYAHVDDIDTFLTQAESLFPALNCGVASVLLRYVLSMGKIVRGYYEDHPHTFLLLPGGQIADITADQYGGPPVYLGKLERPWRME